MSKWQPIETAPMDGTEVLGAFRVNTNFDWYIEPILYLKRRADEPGNWVVAWDFEEASPAFWMPLPEPPND